jgi:hypothetical protein
MLRPRRSSCSASRLNNEAPTARWRSTGVSTTFHTSGNARSPDINQSKLPTAHDSSDAIAFAMVDLPAPVEPLTTTICCMTADDAPAEVGEGQAS